MSPTFLDALLRPAHATRLIAAGARPWGLWAGLTAIALGGSALYGTSLAAALELPLGVGPALWLTLSAGAGWLALGPLLLAARAPLWPCAHACMAAMGWGELLLAAAAVVNLAGGPHPLAGWFNLGWVVVTNLTMAALVGAQLRTQGVHPARTAAAWLVGLCGGGALAGWLLAPLLLPPAVG